MGERHHTDTFGTMAAASRVAEGGRTDRHQFGRDIWPAAIRPVADEDMLRESINNMNTGLSPPL